MDLKLENELDAAPRFCTPFPSDAIEKTIERAFEHEPDEDVSRPELAPYNLKFQGPFYSALELGELMLRYLGSQYFTGDMLASTKWDATG